MYLGVVLFGRSQADVYDWLFLITNGYYVDQLLCTVYWQISQNLITHHFCLNVSSFNELSMLQLRVLEAGIGYH